MMKTMLSEKEIFRIGCEYAANLMDQVLKWLDKQLEENRDKKVYRHKGSRGTTLKSLMGEAPYDRTVYETTLETGAVILSVAKNLYQNTCVNK